MRGTDPTKSKWECPTMFYVYKKDVSLNKIEFQFFVCNSR